MFGWFRKLFSKPVDPGAEYIARLNREAKLRESFASGRPVVLPASTNLVSAINAMQIYGGKITTDSTQPGVIRADEIRDFKL